MRYHEEVNLPYYEQNFPGSGDLEYRKQRCLLDIYYPTQKKDFSTVVYLHGGGLQVGDKGLPEKLKEHELAIVAPSYRLSSDRAKCPDYLEDAAAAVAWVFKNIQSYGGDPQRIYLSGESAGGYMAMMIGMVPTYLQKHGISNMQIAKLFLLSAQVTTHFQILNERQGMVSLDAPPVPVIDAYAPMHHLTNKMPPLTMITGDPELDIPGRPEENQLMASLLRRVAGHMQVQCFTMPGFDHGGIGEAAWPLVLKQISNHEVTQMA